ncbi:MAG: hypothetical protein ACE5J2_07665 [Nitrososphaerales archaeon]
MPFMCVTCVHRPEFSDDNTAINHMKTNPFHMVLWYKSVDDALKHSITEE